MLFRSVCLYQRHKATTRAFSTFQIFHHHICHLCTLFTCTKYLRDQCNLEKRLSRRCLSNASSLESQRPSEPDLATHRHNKEKAHNGYALEPGDRKRSQLQRYLLDNHQKLSLYDLCGHVENLHDANIRDVAIGALLKKKLIDNLDEASSPMIMGRILYLMNKCKSMDDDFFRMIVNHIYSSGLYPTGDSPRTWGRYFKFMGDNRLYHHGLLKVLSDGFSEYLGRHELNNSATALSRRIQESIGIAAWSMAICAPNMALDSLYEKFWALSTKEGIERSVLIRIFWSMAVRNWGLDRLDPQLLQRLLNETLTDPSVGLRKKSHIHQIYTVLRCLKINSKEEPELIAKCLEVLNDLRYGQSDSKISTSQRYVSDVLVRLGVPHKLELLTPDLLSIDIAIEGDDDHIALEVDGPLHFTRVCDDSDSTTPMKTGPTQIKQAFLKSAGWSVLSVPPLKLDESLDLSGAIASVDAYYKRLLLESGEPYLRRLLL